MVLRRPLIQTARCGDGLHRAASRAAGNKISSQPLRQGRNPFVHCRQSTRNGLLEKCRCSAPPSHHADLRTRRQPQRTRENCFTANCFCCTYCPASFSPRAADSFCQSVFPLPPRSSPNWPVTSYTSPPAVARATGFSTCGRELPRAIRCVTGTPCTVRLSEIKKR
jgi:hypothetical protein